MQKAIHVGCLAIWMRPVFALSDKSAETLEPSDSIGICNTCLQHLRNSDLSRSDIPVWIEVEANPTQPQAPAGLHKEVEKTVISP